MKAQAQIMKWPMFEVINSQKHQQALWIYMVIVFGHWMEHVLQVFQVYVLGWVPAKAGGLLGLWFPVLAQSEVLHFVYNFSLLAGIVCLRYGFTGRSRIWWNVALVIQAWHFTEHALLQVQYLTGYYLLGATKQISVLELWFPRVELHFIYNLIVFIPMVLGMYYHFYQPAGEPTNTDCSCSRKQHHHSDPKPETAST